MAKRKLLNRLIKRESINEELKLIPGSETDYITPTGHVYNGYLYTTITYTNKQRQRRVHVLVAECFIPNPNNYPIVMHKDNNKSNPHVDNLLWGTVSQNTSDSFRDKLQVNDKGWDDNQSIPVCMFDMSQKYIKSFGSVGEASRTMGLTKTTILNQCNHNVKTKPRCGYYFRYLSECSKYKFVL